MGKWAAKTFFGEGEAVITSTLEGSETERSETRKVVSSSLAR